MMQHILLLFHVPCAMPLFVVTAAAASNGFCVALMLVMIRIHQLLLLHL